MLGNRRKRVKSIFKVDKILKRSFDTIEEIQGRYEAICEFYFSIFKYTKPINGVHSEKNGLLKRLLYSDEFKEKFPYLFPLDENELENAVMLDLYEFEGSLIGMLLRGTCMESIVADENEARSLASKLIKELRLDYGNSLIAYKLGDISYTDKATVSSFYVLYQSLHRYWMVIGFTDYD